MECVGNPRLSVWKKTTVAHEDQQKRKKNRIFAESIGGLKVSLGFVVWWVICHGKLPCIEMTKIITWGTWFDFLNDPKQIKV